MSFDPYGSEFAAESCGTFPASPIMAWELGFTNPELLEDLRERDNKHNNAQSILEKICRKKEENN